VGVVSSQVHRQREVRKQGNMPLVEREQIYSHCFCILMQLRHSQILKWGWGFVREQKVSVAYLAGNFHPWASVSLSFYLFGYGCQLSEGIFGSGELECSE
jgi:hypothetical protein